MSNRKVYEKEPIQHLFDGLEYGSTGRSDKVILDLENMNRAVTFWGDWIRTSIEERKEMLQDTILEYNSLDSEDVSSEDISLVQGFVNSINDKIEEMKTTIINTETEFTKEWIENGLVLRAADFDDGFRYLCAFKETPSKEGDDIFKICYRIGKTSYYI